MKRRSLIFVLAGTTTLSRESRAQQHAMPVVGFLNSGSADKFASYFAAFRTGLAAMGYVEGHNVAIEYRNAEGRYDRLPVLAATCLQLRSLAFRLILARADEVIE